MNKNRNKIAVDSFCLRLPVEKVVIINNLLLDTCILVSVESGEVLQEDIKTNSLKIEEFGIKTTYKLHPFWNINTRQYDKFCDILINSKILKELYFDGITKSNIRRVYLEILKHKVIKVQPIDFYGGKVYDCDFKTDYTITPEKFNDQTLTFSHMANPKTKRDEGLFRFNKKDNKGIEFGKRTTSSYLGSPYMKFYHKSTELKYNSIEFCQKYLGNELTNPDLIDRGRCECTVKNKAHFKSIDEAFENNTLINILHQDNKYIKIIKNHFHKTFTKLPNTKKKTSTLEGKDILISVMLQGAFNDRKQNSEAKRKAEFKRLNQTYTEPEKDNDQMLLNSYWLTIEANFTNANLKYRFKKLLDNIVLNTVEEFQPSNFDELAVFFEA